MRTEALVFGGPSHIRPLLSLEPLAVGVPNAPSLRGDLFHPGRELLRPRPHCAALILRSAASGGEAKRARTRE